MISRSQKMYSQLRRSWLSSSTRTRSERRLAYLKGHGLGHDREYLVDDLAGQLGRVGRGPQLGEPRVVLEGGDDADEVPLVEVLKVGEGELVGVVGKVDCVNVPSNLGSNDMFISIDEQTT